MLNQREKLDEERDISVQFSRSVVFNSLWSQGLQHARLPCCSPSPAACSSSCALNLWCRSTILSFVIPSPPAFPSFRVFSSESVHCIRWPKDWSFSISEYSNEYSGLISFGIDWFDLLAVQGILKSLLQHHSSKASILRCSAFFTAFRLFISYINPGLIAQLVKNPPAMWETWV